MNKCTPEFFLCSSAVRAKQTAQLIAEVSGIPLSAIQAKDELYEADAIKWTEFIRQLTPRVTIAACVGHNPALSLLAGKLSQRTIDLAPATFVVYKSETSSWMDFDTVVNEQSTSV